MTKNEDVRLEFFYSIPLGSYERDSNGGTWVASRFAASSCALRFSHFAIVLQFSWTKFFTKSEVLVLV